MNLIICIAIFIQQLILVKFLLYRFKNVLHPAIFFNIYVSFQILITLIIFRDASFDFYGIIWIITALLFFSIGSLLSHELIIQKNNYIQVNLKKPSIAFNESLNNVLLIISIMLGLMFTLEFLMKNGISFSALLNFEDLLDANKLVAEERYTNVGLNVSNFSRILLIFTYFSPLIGGISFVFSKKKISKILSIMSLSPSLSIILVQNTKAAWVAGVMMFISGYFVSYILKYNKAPKINLKRLAIFIIFLFSFVLINYISLMMRMGTISFEFISLINKKIVLYVFGHIPAFDIWFSNSASEVQYSLGVQTFYGLADFLGISTRIQGVYSEVVYWKGGSTNVFSIFRSMVEDFGSYLSLTIMLFLGFFLNIAFENIINNKNNKFAFSFLYLASFYFYVLFIFTSAWSYMSYIISFICLLVYLKMIFGEKREVQYEE